MLRDVETLILDLNFFTLDVTEPSRDVRKDLNWLGPLPPEQTTGRVLEVQRHQETILLVKVMGVDVGVLPHRLHKDLSERLGVHLLGEVPLFE